MNNIDFNIFVDELEVAIEMKGKPAPTDKALAVWFRLLAPYPLEHCLKALDTVTASSPFIPTPDGLIKLLAVQDGRPTSDEAWATALQSADESATIIWTDEIAGALNLGASDLLALGDKTAARMAFRDSYNRLITQARDNGVPVNVWVSKGHNVEARNSAIEQAVQKGLLSDQRGRALMLDKPTARGNEFKRLAGAAIASKGKTEVLSNLKKMQAALR